MTDVVVVGSIHIDRIMRVEQLPAPGETGVAIEAWTQIGGKAANQAIASAMLVPTALVACVGADTDGQQALEVLRREGVEPRVRQSRRHVTGSSAALVDARGENLAVISPAANEALAGADVVATIEELEPTVVLCQWESPLETVRAALATARAAGCATLLNAAPWLEGHRPVLPLADHVVVNAVEAAAWVGSTLDGFRRTHRSDIPASSSPSGPRAPVITATATSSCTSPQRASRRCRPTARGITSSARSRAASRAVYRSR